MTTGPPRRISRVAAHWRAGRSTRWPKCTRLGIYLDVAFFLTALAQFGLGIAITHSLNRIPNTFQCRHDSSGPTGSFELVEAKRPLTFTGWNQAKGSLQEMQSNGVMLLSLGDSLSRLFIVTAVVLVPLAVAAWSCDLVFRLYRGYANNKALLVTMCILFAFGAGCYLFNFIRVDRTDIVREWPICEYAGFEELWREHVVRHRLDIARGGLVVAEAVLITTYFLNTLLAMALNLKAASAANERQTDLELGPMPPTHPEPEPTCSSDVGSRSSSRSVPIPASATPVIVPADEAPVAVPLPIPASPVAAHSSGRERERERERGGDLGLGSEWEHVELSSPSSSWRARTEAKNEVEVEEEDGEVERNPFADPPRPSEDPFVDPTVPPRTAGNA